MGKQFNLVVYL